MKLRVTSTVLWLLAGWALGGAFAALFGVSLLIGPVVGLFWGGFVLIDPKHVLWGARPGRQLQAQAAGGQPAD